MTINSQEPGRSASACEAGGSSSQRHAVGPAKLLCRRYVSANFRALDVLVRDGNTVKAVSWLWALGMFREDQYEVLGAWPINISPDQVIHDLHERGIEQISAISENHGGDCTLPHLIADRWRSSPKLGVAGSAVRTFELPELRSGNAAAERLQISITRAIKRRAPFPDDAAAEFLSRTLEKADRRFYEAANLPPAGVGQLVDSVCTAA